ncbi:MAG: Spermidine/putrescine transport system permease protein PotB [Candidatus Dependentiae bacterium ADurb.Bin331]|nr:MAG: Spermidine/putrescine transport system permease protein PotB [Candidatus Dependentiae bacterium ADurb.Bin331]
MGLISEPIGLLNNVFAVAIVMFYCYVPFMIMPIINALEKIDKSLIEASSDLGATHLQTFLRVVLPLSWPGIRTGFFLVFVLTFGEFAIPLLMGGDKYVFVGTAISYYVLNALELEKGAAFTCMSGVALLLTIFILNWVLKRLVHRW